MTEIVQFSIAVLAKFDYITDMKEEEVEKELIEQESDAKSKEDKLPLGTHNLYDYRMGASASKTQVCNKSIKRQLLKLIIELRSVANFGGFVTKNV